MTPRYVASSLKENMDSTITISEGELDHPEQLAIRIGRELRKMPRQAERLIITIDGRQKPRPQQEL